VDITINARTLKEAASTVAKTTPRTPVLPVLSGLHLHTTGRDQVAVHASDGKSHAVALAAADVHAAGGVVVSARLLTQYLASATDGPLTMKTTDDRLQLVSGRSTIRMRQMNLADMPPVPEPSGAAPVLEFPSSALERISRQVGYAAAPKDARPVFGGVQFKITDGHLTCAATDSYRLAITDVDATGIGDLDLVLPIGALDNAARAASTGPASTVKLVCDPSLPTFQMANDNTLVTTTIEGSYPEVHKLMPDPAPGKTAQIDRGHLLDAITRVTAVQCYSPPRVTLSFCANTVEISAADDTIGTATESMPVTYAGEALTIAFNPGYLKDALNATGADTIGIELHGPTMPAVIRIPDAPAFQQLIMPLSIGTPSGTAA